MKAAALVAVALVLCVALPGPIQAKQKSTICVGKDGKNYAVGDSYVDNEGEACIRYKCAKRKGKFIMKKEKCDCNGGNHGISCCPNYVRGDMVGGSEIKITFSPNTENGCQNSCKVQHPTSIGVTQDHDGTSSCYCEFGSPIIGGSANVYKTCLFSTPTSGILKTIKRTNAETTTTTTAPTTTKAGHLPQKGNWKLLFRQTLNGQDELFKKNEWYRNKENVDEPNFSRLGDFEKFRRPDGSFHLFLWYPELGKGNEWSQTSNPVTKTSGGVDNYKGISTPYTGYYWGGLERGDRWTLLDGSAGNGHWWFAIGSTGLFSGGIPGPRTDDHNYHVVRKVELYVDYQVCPPPPFPQNGDWVCDFDNHNCYLQCDVGFTSPISTVRCQNGVWDQGTDNAKCTESFSPDSVYFVAGGRDNQKMYYDTELYSPTIENLQCSITLPEIDRSIRHWLGHYNFYYNNTIYSCGPDNTGLICMSYSSQMRDWKTYKVTPGRRDVSGIILEDTLYLIGGSHEWPEPTSTKLPLSEQSVWSKVPNLNFKGSAQCVAKIDEESLVITGGINYGSRKVADVKQYNAKTSVETSLSPMSQHRFTHGCIVVERDNKKWLIVSGGHNDSMHLQSTEMLQLLRENSSWISLGNLNWKRAYLGMAETVRGVMVMGGNDKTESLKSVELLDWATKRWKVVQPSLKKGRNRFGGALKIPASMFNCQVCPSPPSIKNGNWTCDLDNHSCHLQCDDGFTSPVSTVRCQNGVWEQGTDNAECTESSSSESVYFIAGGYGKGKKYYDIELYSPTVENLQCSITLPQLDDSGVVPQWYLHHSLYHNNTIYICEAGHRYVCLTYNSQMIGFKTYKIGNWGRAGFSAIILRNTLYFIGGSHCNCEPNATPLPLTDQSVWTNVPNLHYKGEYQCVAKIDEDSFVITGGRKGGHTLSYVTQYNAKTSTVTSLPKFKHSRFEHACVIVVRNNKKMLILAGGWNGKSSISSTEMLGLEMEGSSWETLGNLNEKRTGLSMVETERGIMAIGGRDFSHNKPGIDVYHKTVELLDWVSKLWKVVQPSLNKERQLFGGALKIPASMFKCQAADDGEWSAWSKFTACSATCGNTTKTRNRTCSNPSPGNGGKPCPGLDEEVVSCGLSPCGFNMSATCDDVMWLFADGDLLVNNSSDWRVTSEVHIPACTKVIEIHCLDSWIHGGILASSDNGLITDGAWNCSSDNRTTWNPAYLLGRNGRTAPDISPEAIWIWTDMSHWMQTDHRRHTKAICKIELETSQCPEPPVCPPFGEFTPTTISTPTPAQTTTTTLTTSKPKPGFNLTATCDNEMKLFVGGNLLATSSNWRDTSKVNVPANTEAIEIHCMDTGTVGGILASSDNGLLSDGSWNCSSDNGTTWSPAYEVGPNSGAVPDISPEAEWIWTGCIGDWTSKYTGNKYQKNIICKIDLKPVIDGGWSTWRPFSPCSATCADATKARTRTCSQPSPDNGGNPCLGLEEEVVTCGLSPCGEDSEDSCPYTDKYIDCPQWKNHCESGQWGKCVKENCPKTCNCTGSDSVYFLAGGNLGNDKYEIELYHPTMKNLSCSITVPSLDDRTWHTTFYFSNTVYLCGGYNTESTCISYSTNMNGWKTHALTTSRWKEHTSVVLNNRLYLIGGHNSSNTVHYLDSESTPLPLTDQPVLTPVPNLNYKALSPCTAKVDEDTLVVTGGYYNGYLYTAIQYNVKTSTYTSLPSQKQSRSRHGCVVEKMKNTKWIIVSGGYGIKGNVGSPLQSTEMLQLGGRSWIQLGNLNEARQVHSMVATVRGILVMGGEGANGKDLSSVELLDFSIKQWSVIEPSLKTPRLAFGGAVEIPSRMFDCTDTTSTTRITNAITTTTTTMTSTIGCGESDHGIPCCPEYITGDMEGGSEVEISFSPKTEASCRNACKDKHPTSIGVTLTPDESRCFCEFAPIWLNGNDMKYKTCVFSSSNSEVYFIAGRFDFGFYSPAIKTLNCSITPPPVNNWERHTSFYHDNTIYVYGGWNTEYTCISYSSNTKAWKIHTLPTSTGRHSTVVLKNTLYIIGGRGPSGRYAAGIQSTPLPLTDRPILTSLSNMNYKGQSQCTVKLDEDNLMVIGGWHAIGGFFSSVKQFNTKMSTTTSLPSLKEARYSHGCVVAEMDNSKWIVVSGGMNKAIKRTSSTEMLQLGTDSWVSLGNLKQARLGHGMVVTQRGIMVIGGQDSNYDRLDSVEVLDWDSKQWRVVQPSLNYPISDFGGALEIPHSMLNCQN